MAAAELSRPADDSASRSWTRAYVRALMNILEDLIADQSSEDTKRAVVNILEDLALERQHLAERTAELEAANKELDAFAYSVSHDLRAPLRGIDGWSMALLEEYRDKLDGQAQQYLDRIRSETQRMGMLIDELLQLSRVTRSEMRREPVNLTALARRVAARLIEANPGRQIEFAIEPELTGPADEYLLDIALTNLLDNAVKFTGRQPRARIEVGQTQAQGQPAFFVRDNGAGFDMAYAGMLFSAFQRLHRAAEFPGAGIGLATVQRLIHRHGGRIWAEGQIDGGATFYFTLGVPEGTSVVSVSSAETGSAGKAATSAFDGTGRRDRSPDNLALQD
jgi:light-regulated signal transduction histidine kinase (bacteriophytochrome)